MSILTWHVYPRAACPSYWPVQVQDDLDISWEPYSDQVPSPSEKGLLRYANRRLPQGFGTRRGIPNAPVDSIIKILRPFGDAERVQFSKKAYNILGQQVGATANYGLQHWAWPLALPTSAIPGGALFEPQNDFGANPDAYRWAIGGDHPDLNHAFFANDSDFHTIVRNMGLRSTITTVEMSAVYLSASIFEGAGALGTGAGLTLSTLITEFVALTVLADAIAQIWPLGMTDLAVYVKASEILSEAIANQIGELCRGNARMGARYIPSNANTVKKIVTLDHYRAPDNTLHAAGTYFEVTRPRQLGFIGLMNRINPYLVKALLDNIKTNPTGCGTLNNALNSLRVYDRTTGNRAPTEILWFNTTYEELPDEIEWCESNRDLNCWPNGLQTPEAIDAAMHTNQQPGDRIPTNPYQIVTNPSKTDTTKTDKATKTAMAGLGILVGLALLGAIFAGNE